MHTRRSVYFWPVVQALAIQVVALVFCSGSRDGGVILRASIIASAPFWLCAIAIIVWRAYLPTQFEIRFVRWGLVLFLVFGTLLIRLVLLEFRQAEEG